MTAPEERPIEGFEYWTQNVLRRRILARMIHPDVFDRAMTGVTYLPEVLEKQSNQKEFLLPIGDYLGMTVSEDRVRTGRQMVRKHRDLLNQVETTFGVEPEVVAAIWGLETAFGVTRGTIHVLSALATLAYKGQRAAFFEDELANALRIIQARHVRAPEMVGSWAGAMGHGQFMPSSFLDFAVDFDGDGRKDIWGRDPTDALASIANYLSKHGWRKGQPWGLEVKLPEGFDFGGTGLDHSLRTANWSAMGVTAFDGSPLPDYGNGSILLPAGANGVALLVLRNFLVTMRYNRAESYAIAIGHLSDRIGGDRAFQGGWPDAGETLNKTEIAEVQILLTALGFDPKGVDGLRGPDTVRAVRAYQQASGLIAAGFMERLLLDRLRAEKGG